VEHNGYRVAENIIPEFERVVIEAAPAWFMMENVQAAPIPHVHGYAIDTMFLNNRWLGEEQNRLRRFTFGSRDVIPSPWPLVETAALEVMDFSPAVCASGGYRSVPVAVGGSGKRKSTKASDLGYKTAAADFKRLQGLPDNFLDDAPFTVAGKIKLIGNGVPLPMGRAIAKAVRKAVGA
jgi:DNA (cytosine-5)-methyltransferase 1